MRRMVVKLQMMIDDTVVDVVRLQQMFQRPCSLLWVLFDVVDFDQGNVDLQS